MLLLSTVATAIATSGRVSDPALARQQSSVRESGGCLSGNREAEANLWHVGSPLGLRTLPCSCHLAGPQLAEGSAAQHIADHLIAQNALRLPIASEWV
jgi:hypothetical protein